MESSKLLYPTETRITKVAYINDKDKSQNRRIQLTELNVSDGVAKRDGLVGLTIKKLARLIT